MMPDFIFHFIRLALHLMFVNNDNVQWVYVLHLVE